VGKVPADGGRWDGDARGPLFDQAVDVGETVVAGELKVGGELGWGDVSQGFRADGPDGGDPGQAGATGPLMGEIEPKAGADGGFDVGAGLLGDERWIADEESCVGLLQHGDGIGGRGEECRVRAEKLAEEDLGVGERAARGGVCGDGADGGEGVVDEGEVGGALLPHLFEMWGTREMRGFFAALRMTILISITATV